MGDLTRLRDLIISQRPTAQQIDAIFTEELEFLLRAAPGSGKTWTSCRRFIWRGANWPYASGGLALLSFTNAAIREFQHATIQIGRRDLLSDPNYVGTFDAFVERFILSPFGHLVAGLSKRPKLFAAPRPGDRNNQKLMAWTQLKGGRATKVPAWEIIPYPDGTKTAFKASNTFGGQKLHFSGGNPVAELMKTGYYTHSQRIYWACRLLFDRQHLASLIARRFPEIVVDEAQDTNAWLLILLNFIRNHGARVTLIGDPDQCIYEFSMADATSLPALKDKWRIPEKPLSQSFRCNNQIAEAVKKFGSNSDFGGCGDCCYIHSLPLIIRESGKSFAHSVAEFKRIIEESGIRKESSVIICRGHTQLETIRGDVHYSNLQGTTKKFAQAAFLRDCYKNYKGAFKIIENEIRSMVEDDDVWKTVDESEDSVLAQKIRMSIWRFVKSDTGLPTLNLNADEWIGLLRENIGKLILEIGIKQHPGIGKKIRKTGLDEHQMRLPLFEERIQFPEIRQETIHQVKGESIDAVLVLGSSKFWNSVVDSVDKNENSEDRRLAYVAMTRARHLLMVGLPASHYDKHSAKWISWGFRSLRANL